MTQFIRNFCIIAHIDHGKSTLADRLLEFTGTVDKRLMKEQLLDDLDLERQRGITIKARAVSMRYKLDGQLYELNLIDTPGHVDFHYEVSRSLACCEGALLLVDAFQGVEAQTVANAYAAMEHDLKIIPVINKIDLAYARPEEVAEEMNQTLGIEPEDCVKVSAKTGVGVDELLRAIIKQVPPPSGTADGPLQAMVFDSSYDDYRGAITYIRMMKGTVRKGQKIRLLRAGTQHEVVELGQFVPGRKACDELTVGQVGYLICNIKSLGDVHIGDTVSTTGPDAAAALPGYDRPKRMVYCGLFPSDGQDFTELREALERLAINDPSFDFEPETSDALGFGFRCGFLGLLHMEIVQQRLEQESDVDLVQTAPNVTYEIVTKNGETLTIHKPQDVPDDLHDKIKSATRGYGTLDYEMVGYEPAELVRLDILVNGNRVDALSVVCNRADADRRGRAVAKKLKAEIERHMFEVAVQAAIGSRVIARETVPAMRKNVTAKCYGGDITRKRKLLQKQKEGKKRMKAVGNVEISQKAFMAVLSGADGSEG
jgi:GTP-binding protein LepA